MNGYHVTTPRKLARYFASHAQILPPVRFWSTRAAAEGWARRVGRTILVHIETDHPCYPLPDHRRDDGRAYWTEHVIDVQNIEVIRQHEMAG